ncbi:hypothetical protein FSPOR_5197 [Fusarium sporotrichioides]|uniref:Uncharacterized protein n=1 Tax=Fusarium sporotrichioides TaxID=5514 RepID=A0A395S8H6_FUSSP|nr:hypothetical protein FSPOR_5197 [Fusarium sporotrichioides]
MPTATEFFGITAQNRGALTTTYTAPGKFSASGIMMTPAPTWDGHPLGVYSTDFWKNILDASETLAYCCPSGCEYYEVGGCVSTLGPVTSYTYSEYCILQGRSGGELTFISSVDGLTYPDGVASRMKPTETPIYSTIMVDLEEAVGGNENLSDIAVATWAPEIVLIYQESDMVKGEGDSDGDGRDENAASTITGQGLISVLRLRLGLLAGTGMIFF